MVAAKFRITELVARVRDLRQLQLHYEKAGGAKTGDLEATLIRIVSTRGGESQALVTLDERGRVEVRDRADKLGKVLESLPTSELKLAALAQAVKEILGLTESHDKSHAVDSAQMEKGAA